MTLAAQVHGMAYTPHSIMTDAVLDLGVVSSLMFDWAHCYVVDGLCDTEMAKCMKSLNRVKQRNYVELSEHIAKWKAPRGLGDLKALFTPSVVFNNLKESKFLQAGWRRPYSHAKAYGGGV